MTTGFKNRGAWALADTNVRPTTDQQLTPPQKACSPGAASSLPSTADTNSPPAQKSCARHAAVVAGCRWCTLPGAKARPVARVVAAFCAAPASCPRGQQGGGASADEGYASEGIFTIQWGQKARVHVCDDALQITNCRSGCDCVCAPLKCLLRASRPMQVWWW